MPRLRRNEWNFASNAAEAITRILSGAGYTTSLLGRAESELTELRGARRLDLVIFGRLLPHDPLVTGELKVPWDAEGRTPYNAQLLEAAHNKASNAGALYFITWNIRRVVVWKTDDPGVALPERVVYDREIVPSRLPLRSAADLDNAEVREALASGIEELTEFLSSVVTGVREPVFLHLDRLFIARLEAALDYPIQATVRAVQQKLEERPFRLALERWMRDDQGWLVSPGTEEENINRAARFTCYVLVNRLCFYNALRRKYERLPRLSVANSVSTGVALQRRLERAFQQAERYTGDYETVFEGDFGDSLPFLDNEAVSEWRKLVRTLDGYDFANISLDVIGVMYEQLITPEERHRYGQHYTQPTVVDLINSFAVSAGQDQVLDPACGGGTFLVRAYARKSILDGNQDHSQLLENLYGCDLLNYACHLTTINLAIRDLIDDDNFPRVHLGDFLRYRPGQVFSHQPIRLQAGGLVTETREIKLTPRQLDAVVGNPPYISAKEMGAEQREFYHRVALTRWPRYPWRRASDINIYFWLHAADFLRNGGFLALLTQAAWLDVDYGIPLQEWMLDNFEIVAVLETEAEPWFTDARVATAVTILKSRSAEGERAENNSTRFVQFRRRLSELIGQPASETERQAAFAQMRQRILSASEDVDTPDYRIRLITQSDLRASGIDDEGHYVGSKWGRYLRSTATIYELQKQRSASFVPLRLLAPVQRGTTTNCDDFFLVKDVSSEALERFPGVRGFRDQFGVDREEVRSSHVLIVRRSNSEELPLERTHLRAVLKTARDVSWFATSRLREGDFAVSIAENRRDLSRLARRYVESGERHGWHRAPSFEAIRNAGGNWYTLRDAEVARILFVKTMQYSPVVLLNDAGLLANQRLYKAEPVEGVDTEALCAVLNSTIFAAERYAAVKALGREAAIDVEVFSANMFRTPDVRNMRETEIANLRDAMRTLCRRELGSFLDDEIVDAGLAEARAYVASHPVTPDVWPRELRDDARREIDEIVLRQIGVNRREVPTVRERICNELLEHVRKLKLLELEAQQNRRGTGAASGPSARQLADDIWARLSTEGITPRHVPQGFLDGIQTRRFHIPAAGQLSIHPPSLFESGLRVTGNLGRHTLEFRSEQEAAYIGLLARHGVFGEVPVPNSPQDCSEATGVISDYLQIIRDRFADASAEITSNTQLQERILKEGLRRVAV